MKIALGTTSQTKYRYVQEFFDEKEIQVKITSVAVDSGIPEQPLSEKTTIAGARNRAVHAIKKCSECDLGVGLEGGLDKIDGVYHLVSVGVICTSDNNCSTGVSGKLALSPEISQSIQNGKSFGEEITKYREYNQNAELSTIVEELVTRRESLLQALENAFISFFIYSQSNKYSRITN